MKLSTLYIIFEISTFLTLLQNAATSPAQKSDSSQPGYLSGPQNYIQFENHTKIIRDDLIPKKMLFPYYQTSHNIQHGHAPPGGNKDVDMAWQGMVDDNFPAFLELITGQTSHVRKRVDNIRYLMRWKSTSHKWSNIQDKTFQVEKNWTMGAHIKVLIHGFSPDLKSTAEEKIKAQRLFDIGNEYVGQNSKNNIIIVDWTSLSSFPYLQYYEAVDSVRYVAKDLGNLLIWLKNGCKLISNWKDVHLIGFSLGAHVAGGAGHRVMSKTKEKVGRITGIDPAGPQFHQHGALLPNRDNVLDLNDATFVDLIHCNMGSNSVSKKVQLNFSFGKYGTPAQSGHADFYPNGGVSQKGCSDFKDKLGCSHGKCLQIFIKTITENHVACQCDDWESFKSERCACTLDLGGAYLGDPLTSSARGRYYLNWDGV